jgi:hypothetical protein
MPTIQEIAENEFNNIESAYNKLNVEIQKIIIDRELLLHYTLLIAANDLDPTNLDEPNMIITGYNHFNKRYNTRRDTIVELNNELNHKIIQSETIQNYMDTNKRKQLAEFLIESNCVLDNLLD